MSGVCFERVTYAYPQACRPALQDVSLRVEPGELCLLAGLSGHGKSTLLRAACGLVPHFHGGTFAGRVTVAGLDTREHPPAATGAVVGALFQDPETQLVMGTVRAELALALESRGYGADAVARSVEEVALALGVDRLLDRPTHELSGGEQQRIALGAALVGRPEVVVLDEPTSQLDPVAGDELIGLLRRLNQEWDTTILLSEHRLERCLPSADRVIALHDGRLVHDGDPASFVRWAHRHAPALQTPAARLFALAGIGQAPVGVKQARSILREEGMLASQVSRDGRNTDEARHGAAAPDPRGSRSGDLRLGLHDGVRGRRRRGERSQGTSPALRLDDVWFEVPRGPAVLRGLELVLAPGESVALMGRNGAGKSTVLRLAAGLIEPSRGRVERSGRVALMLQNPGDYILHDRVADEASAVALEQAGLGALAERHPRDLSGGERQRLALTIVAGDGPPPAALALDEPTRGMDREAKAQLAGELRLRAEHGQAVIVATHDPEFAAACARRAILLADGAVVADGPASDLLAGGWYFATETSRVLGGAGGALLPEQGALLLRELRGAGAPRPQEAPA